MLFLAADETSVVSGVPTWLLWSLSLIGLVFIGISILRHARRHARAEDDVPVSEAQKSWMQRRRAKSSGAAPPTQGGVGHGSADASIQRLQELIEAADRRIARLQQLNDAATRALAPVAGTAREIAEPMDDISRLAAEGKSVREIAAITGRPMTEISLVLALRG